MGVAWALTFPGFHSDVEEVLGLAPGTVHRALQTRVEIGDAERDEQRIVALRARIGKPARRHSLRTMRESRMNFAWWR